MGAALLIGFPAQSSRCVDRVHGAICSYPEFRITDKQVRTTTGTITGTTTGTITGTTTGTTTFGVTATTGSDNQDGTCVSERSPDLSARSLTKSAARAGGADGPWSRARWTVP